MFRECPFYLRVLGKLCRNLSPTCRVWRSLSTTLPLVMSDMDSSLPVTKKSVRQRRNDEAEIFLENMSDDLKQRKMKLENLIDVLRHVESEYKILVPETLTALNWKIILEETQMGKPDSNNYKLFKYLKYLSLNEQNSRNDKLKLDEKEKKLKELGDVGKDITDMQVDQRRWLMIKKRHVWCQSYLMGHPMVFDFDFDQSFTDFTITKRQIQHGMSLNVAHPEPARFSYTGLRNKYWKDEIEYGNYQNLAVDMHESSFVDVFPKDRLVYLCRTGPPLLDYDPGDIFVIAASADKKASKTSVIKANQMGIRYASLPFKHYGVDPNFKLNIELIVKIMLDMQLYGDWESTIYRHIAPRMLRQSDRMGHRAYLKQQKHKSAACSIVIDGTPIPIQPY